MNRIAIGVAATAALVALSAIASATTQPRTTAQQVPVSASSDPTTTAVLALDALDALKIKGRAAKTGYDRAEFGAAWADTDRNGCDTRNDILRRDLTSTAVRPSGCVVLTGTLSDPYGGSSIAFTRGTGTSTTVQIDHLVALGDAWVKGAQALTSTRRTAFANDPLNLLAVKGSLNEQKRDADAASWLPPRKAFRCDYVARQIAVKRSYALWITAAEHDAMARILSTCDGETLPARSQTAPPPRVPASTSPRYRTCAEVKAAGLGPYYRGQDPEYAWYRDSDADGVVCE